MSRGVSTGPGHSALRASWGGRDFSVACSILGQDPARWPSIYTSVNWVPVAFITRPAGAGCIPHQRANLASRRTVSTGVPANDLPPRLSPKIHSSDSSPAFSQRGRRWFRRVLRPAHPGCRCVGDEDLSRPRGDDVVDVLGAAPVGNEHRLLFPTRTPRVRGPGQSRRPRREHRETRSFVEVAKLVRFGRRLGSFSSRRRTRWDYSRPRRTCDNGFRNSCSSGREWKGEIAKAQVRGPFCGGRGTRTHKPLRATVFKTVRLPITVALHH
jgi:hypothetical protein